MTERTVWVKQGEEVEQCPYCHGKNVWPTEISGLWECQDCQGHFLVRHHRPEPKAKTKAITPEELQALLSKEVGIGNER